MLCDDPVPDMRVLGDVGAARVLVERQQQEQEHAGEDAQQRRRSSGLQDAAAVAEQGAEGGSWTDGVSLSRRAIGGAYRWWTCWNWSPHSSRAGSECQGGKISILWTSSTAMIATLTSQETLMRPLGQVGRLHVTILGGFGRRKSSSSADNRLTLHASPETRLLRLSPGLCPHSLLRA